MNRECRGVFFFFQAEDGIRDRNVTGVQTCALPICARRAAVSRTARCLAHTAGAKCSPRSVRSNEAGRRNWPWAARANPLDGLFDQVAALRRSLYGLDVGDRQQRGLPLIRTEPRSFLRATGSKELR